MYPTSYCDSNIDLLARRRAGAKLGWYIHAGVYLCVNLLLAALSFSNGRHWAIYPALGWGLGLAVHGIVVFVVTGSGGWFERLVRNERARIAQQQRP
ncbi:MAG: 2TM domain-containing protein [Comamonas sp.]